MKRALAGLLALLFVFALAGCGAAAAGEWQKSCDLGARYLNDGNYKEAATAFAAAIKIDARQPKAYAGLSDAYAGLGDSADAVQALRDGIAATGDSSLQQKLDRLKNGSAASSAAAGTPSGSGGEKQAIGTRIEIGGGSYLLITRVDTNGEIAEQGLHDADGTLTATQEYGPSADGSTVVMTKEVQYGGTDGPVTMIPEYDDDLNITRTSTYNAAGVLTSYQVFEYGGDRKLTRTTIYNADGTLNGYNTYTYAGGSTTVTFCNPDGTVVTTSTDKDDAGVG